MGEQKQIYRDGVDTVTLFRIARAGEHYFAIRDLSPKFAFIGASVAEVTAFAMKAIELAPLERPNIISRAKWDGLIQRHRHLQEQITRYKLPTQRGARNRAKTDLDAINREIRAVDGVIGIDA